MNNATGTTKSTKQVAAYFILVFILSIPLYAFAAIVPQEMVMLVVFSLGFPPIIAAIILEIRENGSNGVKRLLKRSFDYIRITRKIWYVPIFFLFPFLFMLAYGFTALTGESIPNSLIPVVTGPIAFLVFFIFALMEEIGWMGYAIDPMQNRLNALRSSLILGTIWAIWHIPFYVFAGFDTLWIVGQLISLIAVRVIIVWIYNNTFKSVFATIVIHTVYNVCTVTVPIFGEQFGHLITSIIILITALIVAFLWDSDSLTQFRYASKTES